MLHRFVAELPTSPLLFIEHCKDTKNISNFQEIGRFFLYKVRIISV